MVARRPTASAFDEAFALDDVYDEPAAETWDAEERSPEGPLTVCLACGASPPVGSSCEHPLVATLERAPADVAAAAQRLAIAARAYHECERALRRLVTREQEAGRAELSSPPPRPLPFARAQAPEASAPPCPRCGFPDTPPAPPRPQRRGAGKAVAQTLFAFAGTSPPAAETADATAANATTSDGAEAQAGTTLAAQAFADVQPTSPVDNVLSASPVDDARPLSPAPSQAISTETLSDERSLLLPTTAGPRPRRPKRGRPRHDLGH